MYLLSLTPVIVSLSAVDFKADHDVEEPRSDEWLVTVI